MEAGTRAGELVMKIISTFVKLVAWTSVLWIGHLFVTTDQVLQIVKICTKVL